MTARLAPKAAHQQAGMAVGPWPTSKHFCTDNSVLDFRFENGKD